MGTSTSDIVAQAMIRYKGQHYDEHIAAAHNQGMAKGIVLGIVLAIASIGSLIALANLPAG